VTELYDALEHCLDAMERGASIDNALKRYPKLASELRPLLTASLLARSSSRVHVAPEVRKRGRAKLLQAVHERVESRAAPRRRIIPAFPRIALTAILSAALLLTSTGLVSASSAALPGQQLYPVKRTWESVQLLFVLNPGQRDLLESNFEQERLDETYELLGQRLAAPISFSGLLSKQSDGHWVISGIPVSISTSTSLPAVPITEGAPVSVSGTTGPDGVVQAQQIQVLQQGASLPPLEPSEHSEREMGAPTDNSVTSPTAMPAATAQAGEAGQGGTPTSPTAPTTYQFSGVVQSVRGNVWSINGQTVYVDTSKVGGQVQVGSIVNFQGYYGADGRFVVTSLQTRAGSSDNKHGNGDGGSSGGSDGGGEAEGGGDGP
jgi:hypothetical protein